MRETRPIPLHARVRIALLSVALGVVSCSSSGGALSGVDASPDSSLGSGGRAGTGGGGGANGTGGQGAGGSPSDGGADRPPTVGSPCASNAQCGPTSGFSLVCQAPGEFLGCGTCQQGTDECANDNDCALDAGSTGAPRICDSAPAASCFCTPHRVCGSGCHSSAVCGAGQGCNPVDHQCQKTCVPGDGTCAVDFACDQNGFCARISCTSDSQCSAACVKGQCYGARGTCQSLPL